MLAAAARVHQRRVEKCGDALLVFAWVCGDGAGVSGTRCLPDGLRPLSRLVIDGGEVDDVGLIVRAVDE